ncbi:APH(3') family aminoglycoside O-phosphotransferase [Blastomonas sp.]|uniref:APH(3') family aminoglycoside O-phosphotransferase n=1 Tax=Blastomonas sp. TaxID=1909299 RepID=UPI0035943EB6
MAVFRDPSIDIVGNWERIANPLCRSYSSSMIADSSGIYEQLIGSWIATPSLVGESGCKVLRLDDHEGQTVAYLKHGKGVLSDAVADEMTRLRWLHSRLPVPEIIRFIATQDECWLMTKALSGESARALLDKRRDDRELVIDALADFLRVVHALPVVECPFDTRLERRLIEGRARIDAGLVNEADFDQEQQEWSAEDVWEAIQAHLPLKPDLVVTHGDFSLDNVLFEGGRISGCIDVGGAGLADRYHDLAICWSDLAEYGVHAQERLLKRYGVGEGDRRKLQTYQLLNELF